MLLLVVLSLVFLPALLAGTPAEHTIGATCAPTDGGKGDCIDPNAICPAAGKCECKPGYSGPDGGQCTPQAGMIGGACLTGSACGEPTTMQCSSASICQCKSGLKGANGTKICSPDVRKIGGSCKAPGSTCDDTTNAKCDQNVCTCNDGYKAAPGAATCDQRGGATVTSFSSLLYFFVAMTSVAAVIAQ